MWWPNCVKKGEPIHRLKHILGIGYHDNNHSYHDDECASVKNGSPRVCLQILLFKYLFCCCTMYIPNDFNNIRLLLFIKRTFWQVSVDCSPSAKKQTHCPEIGLRWTKFKGMTVDFSILTYHQLKIANQCNNILTWQVQYTI